MCNRRIWVGAIQFVNSTIFGAANDAAHVLWSCRDGARDRSERNARALPIAATDAGAGGRWVARVVPAGVLSRSGWTNDRRARWPSDHSRARRRASADDR